MAQMIDSRKQQLNSAEIVTIALHNTKSQYAPEVAYPAVLAEMSQPNTKVKQIGNTMFVVHMGDDGNGFFKALNADTAPNFLRNSIAFCAWAKNSLGMKNLVTEFTEKSIEVLFRTIAKNPPFPDMGYQVFHMKSGATRIVLGLGK